MIQDKARRMIEDAVKEEVSDLYLLPKENCYELIFRTSKSIKIKTTLDHDIASSYISHFKFISGMNVGEKRRSQLGSCTYTLDKTEQRLRLSTVGDVHGKESLVIRLLHSKEKAAEYWFNDRDILTNHVFTKGLYLFSGPVGSGKTTLMYSLAKEKFAGKQIITIEDPVEIVEYDFLQLQVNKAIGNDYDSLIKLSLRHRPDLLIVGEIRDEQTARAVIRASLTGYTVFSTVHAKSSKGVIDRLLELGISETELFNSLDLICYQRILGGKGMLDISNPISTVQKGATWNEKLSLLFEKGRISWEESKEEEIKP